MSRSTCPLAPTAAVFAGPWILSRQGTGSWSLAEAEWSDTMFGQISKAVGTGARPVVDESASLEAMGSVPMPGVVAGGVSMRWRRWWALDNFGWTYDK